MWYEKLVDAATPKIMFYAEQTGPIFSRKHQITVDICDNRVAVFDTDNPDLTYSIEIDLPKDLPTFVHMTLFGSGPTRADLKLDDLGEESVECRVEVLPTHYVSHQYHLGNEFNDQNRPHNVVLKFGDLTLYGNKVVLALWSDYFNKLFFSSEETSKLDEFQIDRCSGEIFSELLDMCLNSNREFHHIDDYFSIQKFATIYILQMSAPLKFVMDHGNVYVRGSFNDVMTGLTLSDVLNIPSLTKKAQSEFERFNEGEKKRFLTEHGEDLRNISVETRLRFLNETPNSESDDLDDRVLPELHSPSTGYWDRCETGVNTRQDVCLLVGDERFEVHKEYLAFWSPYFDRLFFGDFIVKEMTEMEIKEVDPQEFFTLLELIYPSGDIKINDSNVAFLLKLADRFEIKSVSMMCCAYVTEWVKQADSHEEIMDILEIADQYFLVDPQIVCFDKMSRMIPEEYARFHEENLDRLANLSENTRNNINLST